MVTIKEIAQIAGVHRSTVDKVLHKRPGVSAAVRAKVQRIIDELDYQPNPLGLALKKKQDKITLAAMLLDVDALESISSGIKRAEHYFSAYNLEIIKEIAPHNNVEKQLAILNKFIENKVDGILLMPSEHSEIATTIDYATECNIPVITLNSDIESSKRCCFVGQNGYRAGRIAGELMGQFLNKSGNILLITDELDTKNSKSVIASRNNGFRSLLEEEYPNIHIVNCIESKEDPFLIFKQTVEYLEKNPNIDGIYITCGGTSEVGRALRMVGKEQSIRVICFERYPEIIELMKNRVITCTLDSDLEEQGYLPCSLLMDKLLYDKEPCQSILYTTTQILTRESIDIRK